MIVEASERWRRAKLESALARVDAVERRAVADMASAGYKFQSVAAARRYLSRLRAVDRFNRDFDIFALEAEFKSPTRRRTA